MTDHPPEGNGEKFADLSNKWPHDALNELTARCTEAADREFRAAVAGDKAALNQAILDKFEAMADRQELRDDLATSFLSMGRIAVEEHIVSFSQLIEELPIIQEIVNAIAVIESKIGGLR